MLLSIAVSAVLWGLGTGLHPVWWLTWFAALPILWLAPRQSWTAAFGSALLAFTLGALNQWSYLRHALGMPLPPAVMITVLPSLPFAVAVLVWRGLLLGVRPLQAAFAFAAVPVAAGFAMQELSPHSTWGSLAYTQMDCLPIVQIASLAGVTGISFTLLFVPAALLAIVTDAGAIRRRATALVVILSATLALLAWGEWRLHQPAPASVMVGLIASDVEANLSPRDPADRQRTVDGYSVNAMALISRGAQLIVIPERMARVDDADIAAVDGAFAGAASHGAVFVAGLHRFSTDGELNEARVYSGKGDAPLLYEKHHLLPLFESRMRPGTARLTLDEPSGRWGVAICKDLDFPELSRQYGNDGIGLLAVPAWDFEADGWLHDRMAVLRGVESGFSIARAAKQGLLTLSDDRGRVLAEVPTDGKDFATLLGRVPVRHDATLYARWGDGFAWLVIAGLVLVGAGSLRRHGV